MGPVFQYPQGLIYLVYKVNSLIFIILKNSGGWPAMDSIEYMDKFRSIWSILQNTVPRVR